MDNIKDGTSHTSLTQLAKTEIDEHPWHLTNRQSQDDDNDDD